MAVQYDAGRRKFPAQVGEILKAANAAEQAHYELLKGAGFKPLATKFWVPDSAVSANNAPAVIEKLKTLFVNAYPVGTTVFAKAGNSRARRPRSAASRPSTGSSPAPCRAIERRVEAVREACELVGAREVWGSQPE